MQFDKPAPALATTLSSLWWSICELKVPLVPRVACARDFLRATRKATDSHGGSVSGTRLGLWKQTSGTRVQTLVLRGEPRGGAWCGLSARKLFTDHISRTHLAKCGHTAFLWINKIDKQLKYWQAYLHWESPYKKYKKEGHSLWVRGCFCKRGVRANESGSLVIAAISVAE